MDSDAFTMRRRLCVAARAPGFTAAQLAQLIARYPDLAPLDGGAPDALATLGLTTGARSWLRAPDEARVDADLRWLDDSGVVLLAATDDRYPPLLLRLPDAPAVLYVRGDPVLLAEPQLAMVGSRTSTAAGRETAHSFAGAFARAGLIVTSGLALGIDAACHAGALDAGGDTIAVLGTGLDEIYPAANAALAERIAGQGAVITEFPPGTPPLKENFPHRNRIIAGLGTGTLVIEAACRSGSLITARLAGDAGREVFAIPGSIRSSLSRGCHQLIRQGAKLVECPEDVLLELKISLVDQIVAQPRGASGSASPLDKEYKILLDALAFEPASVDSLIERTGMSSESIASMLLILELDGHVAPHPGGRYIRMAGQ
jgi:DNA processing protein